MKTNEEERKGEEEKRLLRGRKRKNKRMITRERKIRGKDRHKTRKKWKRLK